MPCRLIPLLLLSLLVGCASDAPPVVAGLNDGTAATPEASPEGERARSRRLAWEAATRGVSFADGRLVVTEPLPDVDVAANRDRAAAAGEANERTDRVAYSVLALRGAADRADIVIELGTAMIGAGRIDLALVCFDRAVELAPRDPATHAARAEALARDGRLAEAIDAMQVTLTLDSTDGRAHRKLATWYALRGETELARTHLARAEALGEPIPPQLRTIIETP